jgi:predicted N-acetyltransferase YhbS
VTDVRLRPIEPGDGSAIDVLMRTEAQTTRVSLSTEYLCDLYVAFLAQHPSMIGVVAEAPGFDGLVGLATAYLDEVRIGGAAYPAVHLENLKVHHDLRRQGVGSRLAAWRIDEARRRHGDDVIVTTGIESTNAASLAVARRWSTQLLGPIRLIIARTTRSAPSGTALTVRPLRDDEIDPIIAALDAFYAEHDLVPALTTAGLIELIGPTALEYPIRQYRVAVDPDGSIVAGAAITERYRMMVDHIDAIPWPAAVLGRLSGILPADRTIRSIELHLAWHAPGRADAGRELWNAIRYEWRDRATNVVAQADPRGPLGAAFHVGPSLAPKVELVAPVHAPFRLDPERLLYMWR